jgi:hypothetical protein
MRWHEDCGKYQGLNAKITVYERDVIDPVDSIASCVLFWLI